MSMSFEAPDGWFRCREKDANDKDVICCFAPHDLAEEVALNDNKPYPKTRIYRKDGDDSWYLMWAGNSPTKHESLSEAIAWEEVQTSDADECDRYWAEVGAKTDPYLALLESVRLMLENGDVPESSRSHVQALVDQIDEETKVDEGWM